MFACFLFVKNAGKKDTKLSGVHFMINHDVIDRGKQKQFIQPVINLYLYGLHLPTVSIFDSESDLLNV